MEWLSSLIRYGVLLFWIIYIILTIKGIRQDAKKKKQEEIQEEVEN